MTEDSYSRAAGRPTALPPSGTSVPSDGAATVAGMEQRLSCVTLGVADLGRSRAFYEALGWSGQVQGDVVFFQAAGLVVALWGRAQLAEDSCVTDGGGWGGVTLAYNTRDRAQVDVVVAQAEAAGAVVGRRPAETFWGGYSGVFIDPDGHPWEVAYNPGWPVTEDGRTLLAGQ